MQKYYTLLLLIFLSCNPEPAELIKPNVIEITESVYASVRIKPEVTYFAQPLRSGIIKEVLTEEGAIVRKGQKLFSITSSAEVKNRLSQATLNLKEATANFKGKDNLLLSIEDDLRSVRQKLLLDSINYKRLENLWRQNIGRRMDLDQARLTLQTTRIKQQSLQKKHAQTLIKSENTYKKMVEQVATEHALLDDFVVRSKMHGRVYRLHKEIGDFISTAEKFAEIGSHDRLIVEMDIDEVDITKIDLGDTAIIALDAYPNEVFVSKIYKIAPTKDNTKQTFRVESRFVQKPPKLYNGLSGEANIIVDNRKNVLTIPSEYLLEGKKVQTIDGERPVKIGVKNMQFVEILSGIDSTTFLVKPEEL